MNSDKHLRDHSKILTSFLIDVTIFFFATVFNIHLLVYFEIFSFVAGFLLSLLFDLALRLDLMRHQCLGLF